MKQKDLVFLLIVVALFLPFFLSDALYRFNAAHGMVMSFLKFGILSTLGELLGLRISTGRYLKPGFGILPRAVVWGIFGMGINMAFVVFSTGVPAFAGYLGVAHPAELMAGPLTMEKVLLALAISVTMNTIFAPVFMTLHKITDTHILATGGTLRGLARAVELRLQEDHPLLLVSGTHHHLPPARRDARALRRPAGCGAGGDIGGGGAEEMKLCSYPIRYTALRPSPFLTT